MPKYIRMKETLGSLISAPAPVASAYIASRADPKVMFGPVGCGKSIALLLDLLQTAALQRPSRIDGKARFAGYVIRRTQEDLLGQVIKTWDKLVTVSYLRHDEFHRTYFFETPSGIPLDMDIYFRWASDEDSIKAATGKDMTALFLDEVQLLDEAVYELGSTRPGRYPDAAHAEAVYPHVAMVGNGPYIKHWSARRSRPGGEITRFQAAPWNDPQAEHLFQAYPGAPPRLMTGYYEKILARLFPSGVIDPDDPQYIESMLGREHAGRGGRKVYRSFQSALHVRDLQPLPNHGLVIGVDFGGTPAAVIGQWVGGVLHVLWEIQQVASDAEGLAAALLNLLAGTARGLRVSGGWYDPAGDAGSQANREDSAAGRLMRRTGWAWRAAATNSIDTRLSSVRNLLQPDLLTGQPRLLIDPRCQSLIAGLAGEYHYGVSREGVQDEKPNKDDASHLQDALQYLSMGDAAPLGVASDPGLIGDGASGFAFEMLEA